MSFRDKADEVKAAGERARSNWTPQGKPLEWYKAWVADRRARHKSVPERENFCHYWRVVAIWYPLSVLRNKADDISQSRAFWPVVLSVLGLAVLAGLVTGSILNTAFFYGLLITIGIFYVFVGFIVGLAIGSEGDFDDDWPVLAAFVTSWPLYGLARWTNSLSKSTKDKVAVGIVVVLFLFIAIMLLSILFSAAGWLWGSVVLGVILAVAAGIYFFGGSFISWIAYRREQRENARYDAWEESYSAPREPAAPKEPGVVSRFFHAVGDFLILLAQVVRVNKWKICPLVEVDNAVEDKEEELARW